MATTLSRTRRWFYILFPLACYFVFAYPVNRLGAWYGLESGVNFSLTILVWAVGVFGMWYSFSGPKMKVRYIVVHWMGMSFIVALLTLLAEVVRLIFPVKDSFVVVAVFITSAILILAAIALSHFISVKHEEIFSNKVNKEYKIAQISDVHIGSRQGEFMKKVVTRLNAINPDYIVVTGDLIDSSSVDLPALQSISELNAKTMFTIGNHERYADLPKILDIADTLGMHTLRQDSVNHEELNFIGIDDADDKMQVDRFLPEIKIDAGKFNVLLYHRPVGWESAMEHGVDLMLSGHTHNGQVFPFNLIVKQQFTRIAGMYRQNEFHHYVSSGTGTWGPYLRLGSLNEITLFTIKPVS